MSFYDHIVNFFNATLIGIFGVVLLVIFCAGLIPVETVANLLPFIIGFNAALTGYNLIRRAKDRLKYKRMWSTLSGIVMVIGTAMILNVISHYYTGGDILYIADFLISTLIAGVFSFLGAVLAIKYFKL